MRRVRYARCRVCGDAAALVVVGDLQVISNHYNMDGALCKGSYLCSREAVVSAVFELRELKEELR